MSKKNWPTKRLTFLKTSGIAPDYSCDVLYVMKVITLEELKREAEYFDYIIAPHNNGSWSKALNNIRQQLLRSSVQVVGKPQGFNRATCKESLIWLRENGYPIFWHTHLGRSRMLKVANELEIEGVKFEGENFLDSDYAQYKWPFNFTELVYD